MNQNRIIFVGIALAISVITNISLYFQHHLCTVEFETLRSTHQVLIDEMSTFNSLIPKMNPNVSKEELARAIREMKPDEKVEVLDDHINWRFYHFWFSREGKLDTITSGS